jgi:predicted membrane protein
MILRRWWAPRRASWWIGVLFAAGSTCFLVAPFPGFEQLVGSGAVGVVFFVGSIFFTSAALLQFLQAEPRRTDWWAALIQLAGTVFFNVNTFNAMKTGLDVHQTNRLVWAPDVFGCTCFLVASYLAYVEVGGHGVRRQRRTTDWWIAAVNLAGSVAFGVSAIASFVVPKTGSILDLGAANFTTALGALGFLVGAVLLVRESGSPAE